ncbi:MAG: glycosyltransferase [Terrimicrobiaceae bacterium]
MAVKPVLFLSSAFGDGHNAAAKNVEEAIRSAHPGLTPHFLDPFREAYGPLYEGIRRLYLTATNRAPRLWGWCFDLLDHTPAVSWQMRIYDRAARRLAGLIEIIQPRLVVSTYPGCNHLLHYAFRNRLKRPCRLLTIITDSVTIHSSWFSTPSDAYAVANEDSAAVLASQGISREKIHVTGFPVPMIFSSLAFQTRPAPAPDGPWKVLFMANFTPHLITRQVRKLLEIPQVRLTVTTGNNTSLHTDLERITNAGDRLELVGWTPEMPHLMASHHLLVCKAGGATVQEALAASLPLLIARVTPGQEEGNARLVSGRGAGAVASSPEDIPRIVRETFADHGQLWSRYSAVARELGTPRAALDLARIVDSLAAQ